MKKTDSTSTLLTKDELQSLYSPPKLNDIERSEYFTFSTEELKELYRFERLDYAVYFAISLAFFKLKYTLINFNYRDVTLERQYVMQRYFPNQLSPRNFPNNKDAIARIENKVLNLVGFSRFREQCSQKILAKLQGQAAHYPRQRQLCKALLNLMIKDNVAVPSFVVLQESVTKIWNSKHRRLIKSYYRYTTKSQRENIFLLLDMTDDKHRIVSIKQDMKQFNTESIREELEKHQLLKTIFLIAKTVLPKLKIPQATIEYYAELINYYNGTRLKQVNRDKVALYLLCYSYSRFQIVNDNLLEAFKKRTLNYINEIDEKVNLEVSKFVAELDKIRLKIHNLLITIKEDTHKTHIKKAKLFQCLPESEFDIAAQLLISDKVDKKFLFWEHIDKNSHSIKLNLRPLFINLDISIIKNNALSEAVDLMKQYLASDKPSLTLGSAVAWIPKDELSYIIINNNIIVNRFEFLLYKQLSHHITTNKLILKYSIKHKEVDSHFLDLPKWKKKKSKLLKEQPFPKLQLKSPIQLLDDKEHTLKLLYQKVNYDIQQGNNKEVILKRNKANKLTWRLVPLEKTVEPNESLFSHFPKRGIIDVMRFVNHKTHYIKPFESILPRSIKTDKHPQAIDAVILSNAFRLGSRAMAPVCDLSLNLLLVTEKEHVRMETVVEATEIVNSQTQALEIFKNYNIAGLNHLSLDGLKIVTRLKNIKSRHSPKFLGTDPGVSSYNAIFNHLPIIGRLIGSNEYEGNFLFEMVHHQNMQSYKINCASTDRHGVNPFNFGWFDLTKIDYAPRIPKPHNETLWGFGKYSDYENLIISPHKIANKNYIVDEWDAMQRMLVSMLTGIAIPSVVVAKMSPNNYHSKTKLAFMHYNHIVRSEFILRIIDDKKFRIAIEYALNRGEAFNNLYRAIALFNGGKFRGQNEAKMILWDQCTRLVAAIILYYNAYNLNYLYLNAKSPEEKALILTLSPGV